MFGLVGCLVVFIATFMPFLVPLYVVLAMLLKFVYVFVFLGRQRNIWELLQETEKETGPASTATTS